MELSFAARLLVYWHEGLVHDPWDVRFFPFEISMFIIGMLGYRLYCRVTAQYALEKFHFSSLYFYGAAAAIVLFLLQVHAKILHYLIKLTGSEIGICIASPLWIALLPILFFFFQTSHKDRLIGELSYPIYLLQGIAIIIIRATFPFLHLNASIGLGSAFLSIFLAALLYHYVLLPLDKKRHRVAHMITH
ncbi:MAG: hypothetical protein ACOYK6_03940 [Chthoniobacterales bacterium]